MSSTMHYLRDGIAAQLIGRDREAVVITLALIAREHVLFVGPPGTAKSLLCRTAAEMIYGAHYVERLLSPTTAPEAIWGPVSISALRQDRYEHVTAGYAADAHILYLDEVGRASPAILDTLLHLLGPERQALIGTQQIKSPLVAAIGSANTWPEDAAMLDRWTLRASVGYLPPSMRRQLLQWQVPAKPNTLTLQDLADAHTASRGVTWSAEALDTFDQILAELDEAGIAVSDRRLRSADKIAKAAALVRVSAKVDPIDLEVLQFVLWSVPDQAAVATQKIVQLANPMGAKIDTMLAEVDEIVRGAIDAPTRLDAAAKLESLHKEAVKLANEPGANGRGQRLVKYVKNELTRTRGLAMGLSAEKIAKLLDE